MAAVLEAFHHDPVSETLLITLWARAVEAGRPRPILADPCARRIAAELDYDFSRFRGQRAGQAWICLRSARFDDWVRRSLRARPESLVVELGVGFDCRRERLVDGQNTWLEVDLEPVIEIRRRLVAGSGRRNLYAGSLTGPGWLAEAQALAGGRPLLIIAEGVLLYLAEAEVRRFFRRVAQSGSEARLIFDSAAPPLVRLGSRLGLMRKMAAHYRWGLTDPQRILTWHPRLRLRASESAVAPGRFSYRLPTAVRWIWRSWPAVRKLYRLNVVDVVPSSARSAERG